MAVKIRASCICTHIKVICKRDFNAVYILMLLVRVIDVDVALVVYDLSSATFENRVNYFNPLIVWFFFFFFYFAIKFLNIKLYTLKFRKL